MTEIDDYSKLSLADKLRRRADSLQNYQHQYPDDLRKLADDIEREIATSSFAMGYIPIPTLKDGTPVQVGWTLYGRDGQAWTVLGFRGSHYSVVAQNEQGEVKQLKPKWLTTKRPDTQERINEDANKHFNNYFNCMCTCSVCPSKIGDKTPSEHYEVKCCEMAQHFDLLRRQQELDGVV